MKAREIYDRIQHNKARLDLENEKRVQVTVDWIVGKLCESSTTGPHRFYTKDFPTYADEYAGTREVVEKISGLGLVVEYSRDKQYGWIDITVPSPEEEGAKSEETGT